MKIKNEYQLQIYEVKQYARAAIKELIKETKISVGWAVRSTKRMQTNTELSLYQITLKGKVARSGRIEPDSSINSERFILIALSSTDTERTTIDDIKKSIFEEISD